MNSDELAYRLEEAERPFEQDIDQAIREWPEEPAALGALTGTALWFLRLRIETSSDFVLQFLVCASLEEGALFDFPAHSSRAEVAGLLLLDWWKTHGRGSAAGAMITAYHDSMVDGADEGDGHGG